MSLLWLFSVLRLNGFAAQPTYWNGEVAGGMAHTDLGELKNMRNSITFKFMQIFDSV